MSDKRTGLKKKKIRPAAVDPSAADPFGTLNNTPNKKNKPSRKK